MKYQNIQFSIVIPTLNEEHCVPMLLDDLCQQTYQEFEVIVVDGKSTDQTKNEVNKFSSLLNLRLISSKESNVSIQRNLGAKNAKNDWVIFMDADNRLPYYFLQGIAYSLTKDTTIHLFTCLIEADNNSPSSLIISQAINTSIMLHQKTKKYFALGAMIGAKKSVLAKHQFDPKYSVGEEQEFIRSATLSGSNFIVIDNPRYKYNLRRLRKEGVLKMTAINAKIFLMSFGKSSATSNNHNYVMLGGNYYNKLDVEKRNVLQKTINSKKKPDHKIANQTVQKFYTFWQSLTNH